MEYFESKIYELNDSSYIQELAQMFKDLILDDTDFYKYIVRSSIGNKSYLTLGLVYSGEIKDKIIKIKTIFLNKHLTLTFNHIIKTKYIINKEGRVTDDWSTFDREKYLGFIDFSVNRILYNNYLKNSIDLLKERYIYEFTISE